MASKVIENRVVEVKVGSVIDLTTRLAEKLLPCEWEGAAFRFPSRFYPLGTACNVEITGRTFQRRGENFWVKVSVEFLQEDEESRFAPGWMLVDLWNLEQVA